MKSTETAALEKIRRAKLYFASGQIEEAVREFNAAEQDGYELVDIWLSRGAALLVLGRYRLAETDFSNVLEVQKENERAYYYRGIARAARGQHRKAIDDLSASLSRNNDRGIAHLVRGLSYAELGNRSEAVLDINSAGAFSDAEIKSFTALFGTSGQPFRNARALMAEENAPWNNLLDRSSAETLMKLLH
jgi:tetratricopeptide (TPR) repeat protein